MTEVKARLRDIAVQASVSEATVSRVLNAKPGVAESTRQAVLTALDVGGDDPPRPRRGHSARRVGPRLPPRDAPSRGRLPSRRISERRPSSSMEMPNGCINCS